MAALRYFFYLLMIPITWIVTSFGIMGLLATYVNPHQCWITAFAGLILPAILVLNLLFFIYWIIKKSRWAILPVIAIAINFQYIGAMYQPFPSHPAPLPNSIPVKMASYNVRNFQSEKESNTFRHIVDYLRKEKIDLVAFQEYQEEARLNADSLNSIFPELPHRAIIYSNITHYANYGLAIYSKYPILASGTIDLHSVTNNAMWADILIGTDTIRFFNVHLQTTNVSRKKSDFWSHRAFGNTASERNALREMAEGLRENFMIRADQADQIRQLIDTTRHPVIVSGDFNDTPASYTFYTVKGDLTDSFRECGKGYGYTFRGIRKLLRIDYIFHAPEIQGTSFYRGKSYYSDHLPVFLEMSIKQ